MNESIRIVLRVQFEEALDLVAELAAADPELLREAVKRLREISHPEEFR
jgi:hypothetical protein